MMVEAFEKAPPAEQLIPMIVEPHEQASFDELKTILNPELFEETFGEERRENIKNVIEQQKLHLRRMKCAEPLLSHYLTKARENVALLTGVTTLSVYLLYIGYLWIKLSC